MRYGFSPPWQAAGTLRLVLPFRRHWPAICISGLFLAVFSAPLVGIALQPGPKADDLFSLVFTLFYLFWGLGWSVGVGILALVFLILILGREVVLGLVQGTVYLTPCVAPFKHFPYPAQITEYFVNLFGLL